MNLLEKICRKCKIIQLLENFTKLKSSSDEYRDTCKSCEKKYWEERHPREPIFLTPGFKLYTVCKKLKSLLEFSKDKDNKAFGLYASCKECCSKQAKKYHYKHKTERNKASKNYYYEHKQDHQENTKKWKQTERGKEKVRKHKLKYYYEVEKKNPQTIIAKRLRSRLHVAIKGKVKTPPIKFRELVGCDLSFLEAYLYSTMTKDMKWEQFLDATLQIDHIIPCVAFDLTNPEEVKKCFHYTNLRLLHYSDNSKKGQKDKKLKFSTQVPSLLPVLV